MSNPCDACLLRYNPVTPTGSKGARFLIVSKGVSHSMSLRKENITPAANEMLAKYMRGCGFNRKDFVFSNTVRCGYDPKKWRAKDRKTIENACRNHLTDTIQRLKPEVIIPLGADAASAVQGRRCKISKVRGVAVFNEEHNAYVCPILDPILAVRYPQNEPLFASDCKTLQRIVEYDYDLDKAGEDALGDYKVITDLQFLIDMQPEYLAFDLETVGTDWRVKKGKIMTMQFTVEVGSGYLLSWDHPDAPAGIRAKKRLKRQLKQLLQNPKTSVIGQNGKYDMVWVYHFLKFRYRLDHDTIMLAALVDENLQQKNLDNLTKMYVPEMGGYADRFNAEFDKSRMDLVPLHRIVSYGVGDTDATLRLFFELINIVDADSKLYNHYRRVSMPGINAFMRIDHRGMLIDEKALDDFEEVLAEYVEGLRVSLMERVPRPIKRKHVEAGLKFSRKAFLLDILFDHKKGFRLKPLVFTETTKELESKFQVPSTSSKDHLPFFFDHKRAGEFCIDLAEWMKVDRLLGTNVRRFRENYIVEGKINPTYGLWTAVTGRVNSYSPNGQNFPKRGSHAKAYRKIFKAPKGYIILEADLSQAELRIIAHTANDPTMIDIYNSNGDIHITTALEVTGLSLEQFRELPKEEQALSRFKAKAVNFGFVFGMWWRNFIIYAKTQYGVEFTPREAQNIRNTFFNKFYTLPNWHDAVKEFALKHGYVRSYDGRIRHLPMVYSQDKGVVADALRQAINATIQEFASSLGVMAISRIDQEIDEKFMAPTGFVHDAIYVLVKEEYVEWGAKTLKHYMETNPLKKWFDLDLKVPIIADVSFGWNAGETFEMEGLSLDKKYKFSKINKDEEGNRLFKLPKQKIPRNNGRVKQPEYLQLTY